MKEVVTQGRRLWIKHGQKYLLRNFLRHIKLPYIALELLQIPDGSGLQTKPPVVGRCFVGVFVLVLQVNFQAVEDRR